MSNAAIYRMYFRKRAKTDSEFFDKMTDNNSLARKSNQKKPVQDPTHLLSPSPAVNKVVVSSRHPHLTDNSRRPSIRSTAGSSSANSRARHSSNGHSSIQMEPGLQALLAAEGRAADMIATARAKRNALMRQSTQESQAEIEAFRQQREDQYKLKLYEATQIEQFQAKLDAEKLDLLEQMAKDVKKQGRSLVKYIIHCVIDQIPVGPHPNAKRVNGN